MHSSFDMVFLFKTSPGHLLTLQSTANSALSLQQRRFFCAETEGDDASEENAADPGETVSCICFYGISFFGVYICNLAKSVF